jgi:hypothetical protein
MHCVSQAFSINRAEAVSDALSRLGFIRSTAAVSAYMNAVLDGLIERGVLKHVDGKLTVTT